MEKKKCNKCGEVKDISEFDRCRNGLYFKCKQCRQQYRIENKEKISAGEKIYRENNKEKVALRKKQYYQANKEKINNRNKYYYQNNKEKAAVKGKRYYKDNKEKISEKNKHYYQNNKEKIIETSKQYGIRNKKQVSVTKKQYRLYNKKTIAKHKKQKYCSNAEYKFFFDKLTVDELPRLSDDNISLEVKCRYCGKYFIPSTGSTNNRVKTLNGTLSGDQYLYCSEYCKQACPVYGQVKYPKGFKHTTSREVNSLVRQMVFERDNWTCQICGKTIKDGQLHCHHMDPVAQNPMFQNDINSCITLCKGCHKMVHSRIGCRYIDLVCKSS